MARATTVVLALAFGLTSGSAALAAPATGKAPDNPFDERRSDSGAESESQEEQKDQKEPAKPPAPALYGPTTDV